jgi:hypothetical protein
MCGTMLYVFVPPLAVIAGAAAGLLLTLLAGAVVRDFQRGGGL